MRARIAMCALLWVACQSGAAVGTACTRGSDCASGTCEFGRCRVGCRINRDCPSGATCFIGTDGAGACSLDVDLGCESGIGRMCASGLVCVADRCEQSCTERSDCPSDADCVAASSGGVMFCIDSRSELDAGADSDVDGGASCAIASMCFQSSGAACALDCMGRVWCWGQEHGGRLGNGVDTDAALTTPTQVVDVMHVPLAGVDGIACAEGFTCAHLAPDAPRRAGHVLCWGYDQAEAIAVSTSSTAADLQTIYAADSVQLSASYRHACMVDRSDGSVRCFGMNDAAIDPQMPPAMPFQTLTAPVVGALAAVDTMRVSAYGACALMRTGSVTCWGENELGQSGAPIATAVPAPNVLATTVMSSDGPLHDVIRLTVGLEHGLVLARLGTSDALSLLSWGANDFAELGETLDWVGDACDDHVSPSLVCRALAATPSNAPTFLAIASEGTAMTSCGVEASTHHVLCWGNNLHDHAGTMGDNVLLAMGQPVLRESDRAALDDAQEVFVGTLNACATRGDGSLWCWGPNHDGQLARAPDEGDHFAVEIAFPF